VFEPRRVESGASLRALAAVEHAIRQRPAHTEETALRDAAEVLPNPHLQLRVEQVVILPGDLEQRVEMSPLNQSIFVT
jgi:hypothetical protein